MTTTRAVEINNGITTSWLPLTTVTSIPAACSSQMYIIPGTNTIVAFDPWQGLNVPFALRCLPTQITKSWSQAATATLRYSLGPFQCPSDFATATTSVVNSLSTSVLCCPSQYTYSGTGMSLQCLSTLTAGSILPRSLYAPNGTWVSWEDTTISKVGTTILANSINGFIFAEATTAGPSSILSTTTPTPTQAMSTTPANPSQPPTTSPNNGLATGAKVGIAVGCVAGLLVLVALFIIFLRRRRQRAVATTADLPAATYQKDGGMQSALSGDERHAHRFEQDIKQDVNHTVAVELPGEVSPLNAGVYEMDGHHQAELA